MCHCIVLIIDLCGVSFIGSNLMRLRDLIISLNNLSLTILTIANIGIITKRAISLQLLLENNRVFECILLAAALNLPLG